MHYASDASIQIVGDWEKQIKTSLSQALSVAMDVLERTGDEALKQAIVAMAYSAAKLTPKSRARRRVQTNNAGSKYVEVYNQGSDKPSRIYKFQYDTKDPKWRLDGTWTDAQRIANTGLAKRSWMWGLSKLGARDVRSAIPGTSRVYRLSSGQVKGYIKENRLSYISDIMPGGWEAIVESLTINKILGYARRKMAPYWKSGKWAEKGAA